MLVRRLLTLMLMSLLAFVSSTSVAAALCGHQDAQQHAAALIGNDRMDAAKAHLEEAAGALAAKKGFLADAGAFALPAFILPPSSLHLQPELEEPALKIGRDRAKVRGLAPPPLLRPPAA